jgi:TonB family protein
MLRIISAAISLAAALGSSVVARPTEVPAKWAPAGKWVVEFADQQCTAGRGFRSGQTQINLNFRPRPTTNGVAIVIEMAGTRERLGIFQVKVEFGQSMAYIDLLSVWPSTRPGFLIYSFGTDREGLAKLASTQTLRVASSQLQIELPVTGLTEVMQVVDRCVADLLTHWGLSEQDQARMASFPVPVRDIASYVSNDDYPSSALGRDAIGQVEARVTVSPAGKASDCQMVRSSGHDDLDKITCKVMVDRTRFHPARDREGRAMASPYAFAIQWVVPN